MEFCSFAIVLLSCRRNVKADFLQHLPHAFLHLSSANQLKKYGSNGKLLVDLLDCQHLSSSKVSLVEPAEVGAVAVQVVAGVGGHWGGSWHIFNVNVIDNNRNNNLQPGQSPQLLGQLVLIDDW